MSVSAVTHGVNGPDTGWSSGENQRQCATDSETTVFTEVVSDRCLERQEI